MHDQCNNTDDKENADAVHDGGDVLGFAGEQLEDNPGQHAEHNAVGNRIGEGHHEDGEERADRVRDVAVKLDLQNAGHHQQADENQSRSGGEALNRGEDGVQRDSNEEEHASDNRCQTGAAALGNAGGG